MERRPPGRRAPAHAYAPAGAHAPGAAAPYGHAAPADRADSGEHADPFAPGDATDTADHWVRLPLFPFGEDRLRAALPSTMTLAEGRWDAYVALGEDEPQRLRPGLLDLRSLGERDPSAHRTWLGVRIPYAARQGDLAVRAWLRWPHAELQELRVADGGMSLRGRLFGAPLDEGARLEARLRSGAECVTAGVREAPGGGTGFSATLPFDALFDASDAALHAAAPADGTRAPRVWDVWLRPSDGTAPVRVGRILDDVPDKKRTVVYPSHSAAAGTATPYYTRDNDLAVRLQSPPG
ncbi:hypothetical protein DVA86_25705 [Streptomyces armeniacus]|uniref:Transferase n=1 Tax=Streptomyces armeniacus TaxID=83291 RepID=A0A345Y173_9ACTN|nr:hypothetical protein DVA86_25705 [Streptomyces armeniacus]